MAHPLINRALYEAIVHFDEDEAFQNYYYRIMDTRVTRPDRVETVRAQILRTYAMLFCDGLGAVAGQLASPEDVAATADRLYVGGLGYDPSHWYRMQHHFPVIDEDNYDRFAALVISDLSAGPLHEAAIGGEDMLLVGELDPLGMSPDQRERQQLRPIRLGGDAP